MIDEKWDIRGVEELRKLFSKPRKGYWFKVDKTKAEEIVEVLSNAYSISIPKVVIDISRLRKRGSNAAYCEGVIYMYSRNHAKSIVHEWYHHLDLVTGGKYDSDDNYGGSSSYGWIFADILWNMILSGEGTDGIFEPDYKGFVSRVRELRNRGYPVGIEELSTLASKYKTPVSKDMI